MTVNDRDLNSCRVLVAQGNATAWALQIEVGPEAMSWGRIAVAARRAGVQAAAAVAGTVVAAGAAAVEALLSIVGFQDSRLEEGGCTGHAVALGAARRERALCADQREHVGADHSH